MAIILRDRFYRILTILNRNVYLLLIYKRNHNHYRVTTPEFMNRDEIIDLTLANMFPVIPLISNIDNEINADINAALVSIYERNMDILNAIY